MLGPTGASAGTEGTTIFHGGLSQRCLDCCGRYYSIGTYTDNVRRHRFPPLIGGFFTARLASTGTIGIGIVLILIWLGGMGMVKQKMDKGRQEDEEKRLREAAIKKLDEEERAKKA